MPEIYGMTIQEAVEVHKIRKASKEAEIIAFWKITRWQTAILINTFRNKNQKIILPEDLISFPDESKTPKDKKTAKKRDLDINEQFKKWDNFVNNLSSEK